jgi:hypothetical protein
MILAFAGVPSTPYFENVQHEVRHITHGNSEITIHTDASLQGWGEVLDDTEIGGRWDSSESQPNPATMRQYEL